MAVSRKTLTSPAAHSNGHVRGVLHFIRRSRKTVRGEDRGAKTSSLGSPVEEDVRSLLFCFAIHWPHSSKTRMRILDEFLWY